jgi:hypothetical protein
MVEITRTFAAAYGGPSAVFHSTVAREGRDLIGHVSCVRAYDRTWESQHLVAAPSKHVAHLVSLGAMARLKQNPECAFFKIWFQEHNSWPRRVFGGFARSVTDRQRSDLRSFRHVTIDLDGDLPGCSGEWEVVEAGDADRRLVADYLATREPALCVRADDLDAAGLALAALGESFAAAGLARGRAILMARRNGRCLGFALAELASPGLSLYEILSTFRLFVLPEGEPFAADVRRALLAAVARFYRAAGRRRAHGLISCDEVLAHAALGLAVDEETWICWTYERQLAEPFCAHMERLFACLRRPRAGGRA